MAGDVVTTVHHTKRLWFWCPGCDDLHGVVIAPNSPTSEHQVPVWDWDGDLDQPTVSPSILVHMNYNGRPSVCHSFLRAGRWEFLSDSTHSLAGQTVDMVPVPDWLIDEGRERNG